jgi:hypothetical protein
VNIESEKNQMIAAGRQREREDNPKGLSDSASLNAESAQSG